MKKFALALVAFAVAAPAAAQDVAPPVKRKPVATATTPAAARPSPTPSAAPAAPAQSAATPPAPAAPQQSGRTVSERDASAALAAVAARAGGDSALDSSLIRVMSRLVAAGRCGEAATLAARDGRKELASRAQQFCR